MKPPRSLTIGVFDSGIGGEAVANALMVSFPEANIATVNDRKNLPYGNKSPDEVRIFTELAIRPLLGCDVIIIACNTATTLALPHLRTKYPTQKFIGIEPMIKPAAALTKTGVICVCATPATLASERYQELKRQYAEHRTVIEPDCSTWAWMIEQNAINEQQIEEIITSALSRNADSIVLGCTHYHWIKDLIQTIAGDQAQVLEPSKAIARQVSRLPAQY